MPVHQSSGEITRCLLKHARGDADAGEEPVRPVYEDLGRIARRQRCRQGSGLGLDPSGQRHEAYLELVDRTRTSGNDRTHVFAVAARAMRPILVDQARHGLRVERCGGSPHTVERDWVRARGVAEGDDETLRRPRSSRCRIR